MSRYYNIVIDGGPTYTSLVNGKTDPGALLVEMDVLVAPNHVPWGNPFVRVWGIPITTIGQASDFNGKNITVYGGMAAGLPLATQQVPHAGLLFQGQIFQAFGNWQDTLMQVEFTIIPAPATQDKPGNFTFSWKKGTPMGTAISNALKAALPGYTAKVNISPKLVFTEDVTGYYATPTQFAQFCNEKSQAIIGGSTYPGVQMLFQQKNVAVYDGSTPTTPIALAFNDLIGQAVWLGPNTLSVKTVMRADIQVGDSIKLPPGQISQTSQSLSQFRQGSVFQGSYLVTQARHVGNSRQPDGNSWCSIYTVTGPTSTQAKNG